MEDTGGHQTGAATTNGGNLNVRNGAEFDNIAFTQFPNGTSVEVIGTGSDALTLEGNLSLIDDLGSMAGSGKQFITVETKTGNVFYLIIDRDDQDEVPQM